MEMKQRWWWLGFCPGGEREILCMFNSANFTRDDVGLLSWYKMFLYFYEWAIYAASMEDLHLVENNGEDLLCRVTDLTSRAPVSPVKINPLYLALNRRNAPT